MMNRTLPTYFLFLLVFNLGLSGVVWSQEDIPQQKTMPPSNAPIFLAPLVTMVMTEAKGFISDEAMKIVNETIWGPEKPSDMEVLKERAKQISAKLDNIERNQKMMAERLEFIRNEILSTITDEQLKNAYAKINALNTQVRGFFNSIAAGEYRNKKEVRDEADLLAFKISTDIPHAVERISQSDKDWLNLRRENLLMANSNIFKFTLSGSYAVQHVANYYRSSLDMLQLAKRAQRSLGATEQETKKYLVELFQWKKSRIIGGWTPVVAGLLDKDSVVIKSQRGIASYPKMQFLKWCGSDYHACQIGTMSEQVNYIRFTRAPGWDLSQNRTVFRWTLQEKCKPNHYCYLGLTNSTAVTHRNPNIVSVTGGAKHKEWNMIVTKNNAMPDELTHEYVRFINLGISSAMYGKKGTYATVPWQMPDINDSTAYWGLNQTPPVMGGWTGSCINVSYKEDILCADCQRAGGPSHGNQHSCSQQKPTLCENQNGFLDCKY